MSARAILLPLFSVLFLALLGSIVWASLDGGVGDGLIYVAREPWGVVTLGDLGAGLLFVALWMAAIEKRKWSLPFWYVALMGLGNLTTLVFLIYRCTQARTFGGILLGREESGK